MKRTRMLNGDLSQAMVLLIRNQAAFIAQLSETNREAAQVRKEMMDISRRTDERCARIESILLRLVEVLPEAVRDRIGIMPEKA